MYQIMRSKGTSWYGPRLIMSMQKIQNGKWTDLNLMDQKYSESVKEQSERIGRIIHDNYQKANF